MYLLQVWILFCALITSMGWVLSIFHLIYPGSYIVIIAGFALAVVLRSNDQKATFHLPQRLIKLGRGCRVLPAVFIFTCLVLFLKGVSSPPNHDDGLSYRIPRAMNWIMYHQWVWTNSPDVRQDTRGSTSEWLTVPILLLFKSDRLVFLPNFICQLFLPGLIFSVWRSLGVGSRIAAACMWLIPTGFCFALQAVDASNDSLGAFFLLSSFYYAFKAKTSGQWADVALSTLCIALASNVKLNCIPFVLPWAIAIFPGLAVLLTYPLKTLALFLLATLSSFAPQSLLNWEYGAGFSGLGYDTMLYSPPTLVAIAGNLVLIVYQNLSLPLLVLTDWCQNINHWLQTSNLGRQVNYWFPDTPFYVYMHLAIEQAGLGVLTLIGLAIIRLSCVHRFRMSRLKSFITSQGFVRLAIFCIFMQFLISANSNQPARLICPYYLLLFPLIFCHMEFRSRNAARYCFLMVTGLMLINLSVEITFAEGALAPIIPRCVERTKFDAARNDLLVSVIPSDETKIGAIRFWNERVTWLWKPYQSRVVKELPLDVMPETIRREGIRYLAISNGALLSSDTDITQWMAQHHAHLLAEGIHPIWYFVRIDAP